MAAQTLVDEAYAKKTDNTAVEVGDGKDVTYAAIENLAEVAKSTNDKGDPIANQGVSAVTVNAKGKVETLTYKNKGKTCTYKSNPTGTEENYNVVNATKSGS